MASADVAPAGSPAGGLGGDELSRISTSYSLPLPHLEEVLNLANPLIPTIYRAMLQKAAEFDELRSQKLRQDVELEQTVRTAETRVRTMKTQLEGALQETQELRAKSTAAGSMTIPAAPVGFRLT